jgi:hypothetical protein
MSEGEGRAGSSKGYKNRKDPKKTKNRKESTRYEIKIERR